MGRFGTLLTLALTVFSLGGASHALRTHNHAAFRDTQRYEDLYYLPPTDWLRVFSFGWDEAAADLIWMRALVYFGDEFLHDGHVAHVFDYAEAIERLDPDFRAVYRWVGVAGLYRPHAITPEDVERSVTFMERGAERFPNDGDLCWDIGAALVFELAPLLDDDAEAGNRARERGMPYLIRAAELGAAPEWAALSNATILHRLGRNEQAARHLEEMYAAVDDPATREIIETRLRELQRRQTVDASIGMIREEEENRLRFFPYLPLSFYFLVGERPVVDVEAPVRDGVAASLAAYLEAEESSRLSVEAAAAR